MDNKKIAEMLEEIAEMLELDEEKDRHFEVRAYRKAALTIGSMQEDIRDLYKRKGERGLLELPGIGKGIAGSVIEFLENGRMSKYDNFKKRYPLDFKDLSNIQGLGAKRIYKLYRSLGVKDLSTLKAAVEKHEIRELEGFGARSEEELLRGIKRVESGKGRLLLGSALPEAETIISKIKRSGLVDAVELAGSARRMRETVGDLDILVISNKSKEVMDFVENMDEVSETVVKGPTKTTVMLKIGITCDVRVVKKESIGAALQYFIGNKDHNVKVRQIAIRKGYKLNEYGLFGSRGKRIAGRSEKEIYEKLGMQIMDPEMREDRGEVELSLEHKIPKLIQLEDMHGDLHVHTNHSDGSDTIEDMILEARSIGREYIGISDHSKSEYVAGGMDDKKFAKHFDEIDKISDKIDGIKVLKSAEIDILKDGGLDLQRKTLERMDYRLGAVHTNTKMGKDEMTKRIIKAFESGYVDILAHPTGRLIQKRDPIDVDLDRVLEAAKDNGVIMEIDSFPERLDLGDENVLKAKREYGLKFSIGSDAHSKAQLGFIRYGVGTAKRGWLRSDEVVNTYHIAKLMKLFKG